MNKLLAILWVLSLGSATALAQTPPWNEVKGELKIALETKPDVRRGEAAFEECVGCHRKDASGRVSGAYPRLAGQHATVLMKQMADIRSGLRNNPKMKPFIDDDALTPHDLADIAYFLEALPITPNNGKGPGTGIARGKQLYDHDCVSCHGAKGEGNSAKYFPMVAAQQYNYVLREVNFIRNGYRGNSNPDMLAVIKTYSSSDLEAVSDYIASLAPPQK